jgi:hypothetical protein
MVDWLFIVLRPAYKSISLIWRRHHYRWRAAKFRPMVGAQGLWAGRDLYRATLAVTRGLGFSGLIRRTAPFSRLLQHTRGGSILTRLESHMRIVFCKEVYSCFALPSAGIERKRECCIGLHCISESHQELMCFECVWVKVLCMAMCVDWYMYLCFRSIFRYRSR